MSARTFAALAAVAAVIALLTFGLVSKGNTAIAVGDPAPDKELELLDGSGTASLADYRGSWVLVNFWASWCDPCRTESPDLQRFYERHRDRGVTVLGIDIEDNSDDAEAFVREFELTYPQLRDPDSGDRQEAYGMTGLPESFLVDPRGDIALIRRGPVDTDFLRAYVEPLVARR